MSPHVLFSEITPTFLAIKWLGTTFDPPTPSLAVLLSSPRQWSRASRWPCPPAAATSCGSALDYLAVCTSRTRAWVGFRSRLGVINRACALEAGGGGRQEAAGGGGIPQDREKADLRLRDGSILKYETRRAPFRPG